MAGHQGLYSRATSGPAHARCRYPLDLWKEDSTELTQSASFSSALLGMALGGARGSGWSGRAAKSRPCMPARAPQPVVCCAILETAVSDWSPRQLPPHARHRTHAVTAVAALVLGLPAAVPRGARPASRRATSLHVDAWDPRGACSMLRAPVVKRYSTCPTTLAPASPAPHIQQTAAAFPHLMDAHWMSKTLH